MLKKSNIYIIIDFFIIDFFAMFRVIITTSAIFLLHHSLTWM